MIRECEEHGYFRDERCPHCGEEGKFILSDKEVERIGRTLAAILRHGKFEPDMDDQGWVPMQQVVALIRGRHTYMNWLRPRHIEALVETDPKGRYSIAGGKVRATYGHTIPLDLKLDNEDIPPELFYPERIPTPRFTITYTGRLLSLAIRDPELLFIAVARLAAEGTIAPDTFRVVWYTDPESKEIIEREAGRHGIGAFMEYHDYVPADKVPRLLNESSVLLSLTNKAGDNGPKGFMTTKFFEFLAVEKPILCVRSDESYLAETIRRLNAGVAASTADEAYDFLKRHYEEWKEKGYTTVDIRRDRLAEFSRKEQAKQFARIFDKL